MEMLPAVVERLQGSAEVILDGGVRRGTDMLKAIALGAAACMGGRIGLYGLGAGGASGAEAALARLRAEFIQGLALLGTSSVGHVDEFRIRSEEHTSELQLLLRHSYGGFSLTKKKPQKLTHT